MERIFMIEPSWDKQKDPKGNFGVSDATLWMGVKKNDNAVVLKISTGWFLTSIVQQKGELLKLLDAPNSYDLSYHGSIEREYDSHCDCCKWTGKPCHYNVTSSHTKELLNVLVSEGSEALYSRLEELYNEYFKDK